MSPKGPRARIVGHRPSFVGQVRKDRIVAGTPAPGGGPDGVLVYTVVVALLADLAHPRDWSRRVCEALASARLRLEREAQRRGDRPEVAAQYDAGWQVAHEQIRVWLARGRPPLTAAEQISLDAAVAAAVRAVAGRQQARRPGPKPKYPRSVVDGWRWRGSGRPPTLEPPELLRLRVEVWRDLAAAIEPDLGKLTFRQGLAAVLYWDLQQEGSARASAVDRHCRELQSDGFSRPRALLAAVRAVLGSEFESRRAASARS